ncbi:MAG: rod shape-determining protein MreD [Candidatus Omnitrophica bacterium]|nr:rod shape-determining protein MreD [Candidatus Omnitrophota bacterium]MDD5436385.1 rod shape-determining protein MreD [Candidatus Omnitrophota bacterium]
MYKITRFQIYLVLLIALFLQGSVVNYVKIMGSGPDLLLMIVIFFGLFLGPAAGLESGFVAGFLRDIFALDFLWINAVILALSGFIVGVINTQFFKESKRADFIFVLVFTALSMSLHYLIVSALVNSIALDFWDFFISSAIPTAVYTGLVSVPVYVKLLDIYHLKEAEDYL